MCSGYVVVLYGALSLVSGKVVALTGAALLLFIVGIALAAFLIDYSFVLRKMRVVVAGDELIDLVVAMANGSTINEGFEENMRFLLYVSGENSSYDTDVVRRLLSWKSEAAFWLIYFLSVILFIFCR